MTSRSSRWFTRTCASCFPRRSARQSRRPHEPPTLEHLRTLVISDLHLGTHERTDLLRRPELRAPLLAALADVDRVVLLGDVLELRHGPLREALAAGQEFLAALGEALGVGREVVIVPGNHDHHLLDGWLARRARRDAPPSLGLESAVDWRAGEPLAMVARRLGPATVRAAYPGVWLRDDVYAMHGHYSARHTTIPMFERLGAGAMARVVGEPPGGPARAEDFEATLAPLYAWIHAVAQSAGGNVAGSQQASSRAWRTLAGRHGGRSLRRCVAVTTFPAMVAGLNRAGLGPLQSDVSMPALSAAGLRATAQVLGALGVDAPYVIFGHTHRAGPFAGDAAADWATAAGGRMINAGSWVYDRPFVGEVPNESPYWPGTCVVIEDDAAPELRRLLGSRGRAELEPKE